MISDNSLFIIAILLTMLSFFAFGYWWHNTFNPCLCWLTMNNSYAAWGFS